MKWRVRAKSGTSFEREMKKRSDMTLQTYQIRPIVVNNPHR
jgi:hypothetical protein